MALTSQSHLAITDVLCIPYRMGFSRFLIPVPIQIILAIPDEIVLEKKNASPPPLPAGRCKKKHPLPYLFIREQFTKLYESFLRISRLKSPFADLMTL